MTQVDWATWRPGPLTAAHRRRWRVPYAAPEREYVMLKAEIDDSIRHVLESGRYVGGRVVEWFEADVAAYLNIGQVVAVKSGTEALALVRQALYVTNAAAFARPVVTHRDGLIERTAPDDVEDAAQAFGSRIMGRKAGTLGLAGCFSLHPLKTFSVMGGGGLVATNDDRIAGYVRSNRGHGLDVIQCAVGRVKLRYVDDFLARKREIARRYAAEMPERYQRPDYEYPSNYPVLDDGLGRALAERGVETLRGNAPNTVNLPLHAHMTDEEVAHVIRAVRESTAGA